MSETTTPVVVVMRLPHRRLHPNSKVVSRGGAMAKSAEAKKYRETAHTLALSATGNNPPRWAHATAQATFYFPNSRRQCQLDRDNANAAIKNALDGIADAGVVGNDRNLVPLPPVILCDPENPRVEITITEQRP